MILDKLAEATLRRVQKHKESLPFTELRSMAENMEITDAFPFERALKKEGIHEALERNIQGYYDTLETLGCRMR